MITLFIIFTIIFLIWLFSDSLDSKATGLVVGRVYASKATAQMVEVVDIKNGYVFYRMMSGVTVMVKDRSEFFVEFE